MPQFLVCLRRLLLNATNKKWILIVVGDIWSWLWDFSMPLWFFSTRHKRQCAEAQQRIRRVCLWTYSMCVCVCFRVCERDFKAAEKTNTHTFTEERKEHKQEEDGCSSGLIITYFTDEGWIVGDDSFLFLLLCFPFTFFHIFSMCSTFPQRLSGT